VHEGVAFDAGVVEGAIEASPTLDGGLDEALDLFGIANVGLNEDCLASGFAHQAGGFFAFRLAALPKPELHPVMPATFPSSIGLILFVLSIGRGGT
jgi:hypothetical protein